MRLRFAHDQGKRTQAQYPSYVEDQRAYFDRLITEDWAAYESEQWNEVRAYEVRQLFARIQPRRVLDVGCGSGYHDLLMATQPGVDEVVGIDYSPKSIDVANHVYPHPRVRREVADLFDLTVRGFDLVISFQVIEHVTDPSRFLHACAAYARTGGWVGAVTPNRERLTNSLRRALGLRLALEDPQHYAEYTVAEVASIGRGIGLRPIGSFSYGLSLYLPRLGWQVIPQRWAHRVGYYLPSAADRFAVLFVK